ncbi:MAG: lysyl-tRNA synthetase, partial [Actinomycetota bacterium]
MSADDAVEANNPSFAFARGYRQLPVSSDHEPSTDTPFPPGAGSSGDGDDTAGEEGLSGSGLAAEKAKRLQKLAELHDAGTNPYPYRFDRTHTLAE